jgi:hypothetical protein
MAEGGGWRAEGRELKAKGSKLTSERRCGAESDEGCGG